MKELIIHKWWISNDMQAFTTIDDKLIKVIEPGKYNLHDGPDFLGTTIEVDGIKLIGNTEIHICEEDYRRHRHIENPHFTNVILHVFCFPASKPILEIPFRIQVSPEIILNDNNNKQNYQFSYDDLLLEGICRLRQIGNQLINDFASNDLIFTLYISLFRAMGLKDNAIPMTMLANKISYKIFYDRYNLNEIKVAYLFASGLYNEINPSIEMISKKYQLLPLSKDIWMHKGIRPNAYPIIRIPKAVECFYYLVNEADFFHKLIINGCDFWFKKLNKILTIENKKIILANCILPLRIWYAERYGLMNLMEHIINEGSKYDAENNKLIEKSMSRS